MNSVKGLTRFSTLVAVSSAGVLAHAVPIDLSPITSGIDFSSVGVAIIAIAGLLATVYVAMKGAKIVLGMLKGG